MTTYEFILTLVVMLQSIACVILFRATMRRQDVHAQHLNEVVDSSLRVAHSFLAVLPAIRHLVTHHPDLFDLSTEVTKKD